MIPGESSRSPQQVLRVRALLVLAVLAGLVGMHGLGTVDPTAPAHRAASAHHQQAAAEADHPRACPEDDGQDGPAGHGSHADPMCSSASVPSSPAAPAPAVGAPRTDGAAERPAPRVPAGPDGGRAPPSLAELQLLRI